MKVNFYTNNFNFKSENQTNVIGFDDECSQETRNFIREHYSAYTMPYQSIYENEHRKSDYELKQFLKPFMNKPKSVDYESVFGLPVVNIADIGNNSYRGATLAHIPKCLETLKKSGIEQIIDLGGYKDYKENTEKAGLKYFEFDMKRTEEMGFWKHPAFIEKDDYRRNIIKYCAEKKMPSHVDFYENKMNNYEKKQRIFIEKFTQLIALLQRGFCYIGCEYGTYDTNDAMLLNKFFNPKAEPKDFNLTDLYKIQNIRHLFNLLNNQDKFLMGWDKNFDKEFNLRTDKVEKMLQEKMKAFAAR